MKKYRVLKTISLDFIFDRDQQGYFIDPAPDVFLESDGVTIWLNNPKGRFESINTANLIDFALQNGSIEEIV